MGKNNLRKKSIPKWNDVPNDGSLNSLAVSTKLSANSLQIQEQGVIILPNNTTLTEPSKESNIFAQSTKDVMIALQDKGIKTKLYDDGREKRELILKSNDIIMPILLFVGQAAASASLAILASWIYDRWIKGGAKQPPSIKAEYVEIDRQGSVVRWRKIEGPVSEVQKLFSEESKILAGQSLKNTNKPSKAVNKEAIEDSWWKGHCKSEAQNALSVANDFMQEANDAINNREMDVAEKSYRSSLAKIWEALLWEPEEGNHRKYLHTVGRKVRDIFGCRLEFRDGSYWITCPVMLSHTKVGLSIGGSGKSVCSICGEDIFDCPHVTRQAYDNVIAKRHQDICNICGKKECAHIEGDTYNRVRAFAFVVELNLDHIAFVENPSDPLAVITSYALSKSELLEILPEDKQEQFFYGETKIYCNHCLICQGI